VSQAVRCRRLTWTFCFEAMAMNEHMDKLVGLFLAGALEDDTPQKLQNGLTPEAVERGIAATVKMLSSDEAIQMGMAAAPSPTFVCLAMAMEEKPNLGLAAVRCYETALKYLRVNRGSWERIVVQQQLGAVCLREGNLTEACRYLAECSEECHIAVGHPRDAVLFGGAFNTTQTRVEFTMMVEKFRAQVYYKMGDMQRAQEHVNETKRLEGLMKGDAVERAATSGGAVSSTATGGVAGDIKALWAANVGDSKRLKSYRFSDEGATVLLILDLNDHLGIGDEASELIDSLKQFKVGCDEQALDIKVRLRRAGQAIEFQLLLSPLSYEVVPEDTVPKLKGREGKRRLEVKLFKRDKTKKWYNDIVKDQRAERKAENGKNGAAKAKGGTQLNPLTPEELAKLPKPSEIGSDNRPSSYTANTGSAKQVPTTAASPPKAAVVPQPASPSPQPAPPSSQKPATAEVSSVKAKVQTPVPEPPPDTNCMSSGYPQAGLEEMD